MTALPWSTFPDLDPSFVDKARDTDLATAFAWSLHIRVPDEYGTDLTGVVAFHSAVLAATERAHTWLSDDDDRMVSAACGGDSFQTWCEPFPYADDDDARALHLYFSAPDANAARLMSAGYLSLLGLTTRDVALSTAGDWAEQLPIPSAP